jgi:hypothetical protein
VTETIGRMAASPHITFRAPRELWEEAKVIAAARKENLSLHVLRPALEAYVAEHRDEIPQVHN